MAESADLFGIIVYFKQVVPQQSRKQNFINVRLYLLHFVVVDDKFLFLLTLLNEVGEADMFVVSAELSAVVQIERIGLGDLFEAPEALMKIFEELNQRVSRLKLSEPGLQILPTLHIPEL